jgi:fumarate reductase subunit D
MAGRSLTPLPWLLFSAGGVMAALFLPVLVFLFGLAFPLGWIAAPEDDHLAGLLRNPLTIAVVFVVLTLSLFHWAHRFRYTLYDGLQIKKKRTVAVLCYGTAIVGSTVTLVVLLAAA